MHIAVGRGPDPYPFSCAKPKVETWCLALAPLAAGGKGKASLSCTLAHLASLGQHWGPVLPAVCTLRGWGAYHLPSPVCKAGNMSPKKWGETSVPPEDDQLLEQCSCLLRVQLQQVLPSWVFDHRASPVARALSGHIATL